MNKKFFTLIASVFVLAGLVGSASARDLRVGSMITSFPQSESGLYLYQLGVDIGKGDFQQTLGTPDSLLSMDANGKLRLDSWTGFTPDYGRSLWCIQNDGQWQFEGALPAGLQFTNKASQYVLMADVDDSRKDWANFTSGTINGVPAGGTPGINVIYGQQYFWGMSTVYNMNIQQRMPIYSFFTPDSVVVLLYNDPEETKDPATGIFTQAGDDSKAPFGFSTARIAYNDLIQGIIDASHVYLSTPVSPRPTGETGGFHNARFAGGDAGADGELSQFLVWVTILKPSPIILTANDFNTRLSTLGSTYRTTNFTNDRTSNVRFYNPWSEHNLVAQAVHPTRIDVLNEQYSTGQFTSSSYYTGSRIPGGAGSITSATGNGQYVYQSGLALVPEDDKWVSFQRNEDIAPNRPGDRYLYVDTAYADTRTQYLTFNFGQKRFPGTRHNIGTADAPAYTTTLEIEDIAGRDRDTGADQQLEGQYYFRLTYNAFNDSLGIDVAMARYAPIGSTLHKNNTWFNENTNWGHLNGSGAAGTPANGVGPGVIVRSWSGYADINTAPVTAAAPSTPPYGIGVGVWSNPQLNPSYLPVGSDKAWLDADYLHVGLVDIDNNKTRLITLRPPFVETNAYFGIKGCGDPNATSVPEGLYVITDERGFAFGVPINTDSVFPVRDSKHPPIWMDVVTQRQSPQDMPSYQWIVKHTNRSDAQKSPLRLINREFPNIVYQPVQLKTNSASSSIAGFSAKAAWFNLVKPEKSLNEFLGYKYLTDKEIEWNTYGLNYLHTFNATKYLAADKSSGKSSGLIVQDEGFEWRLEPITHPLYDENGDLVIDDVTLASSNSMLGKFRYPVYTSAPVEYGYKPSESDTKNLNIVQLKRTAYRIVQASNKNVLHIDDQKTYVTTAQPIDGSSGRNNIYREPVAGRTTTFDGTSFFSLGFPFYVPDTDPNLGSHLNGSGNQYAPNTTWGLGNTARNTGVQDFGVFLLKTQNTADGQDFYALLDTNSYYGRYGNIINNGNYNYKAVADYIDNNNQPLHIAYTKVGIEDASGVAYAQNQTELRTSAFSIAPYSAPLYRRFDGGNYKYGDGIKETTEEFHGDLDTVTKVLDPNAPLYLKFYTIPDNFYLYENSPKSVGSKYEIRRNGLQYNKNISFLDAHDIIHFPEQLKAEKDGDYVVNYEFYVDTAFVKRNPLGQFQEPYTPMPQYMLALHPDVLAGGKVWVREGDDIFWGENPPKESDPDRWGEWVPMDLPGLVRGKYLFNPIDSIYSHSRGQDYVGKRADYIENYYRFAFVDGVHMGDTFYVLPENNTWSSRQIQRDVTRYLYNLPVIRKVYLGENTHFEPRNTSGGTYRYDTGLGYDDIDNPKYPDAMKLSNGLMLKNGKSMVFQFRLKNGSNKAREFFIETQRRALDYEIGPSWARYLNYANGAIVRGEEVPFESNNNNLWNDMGQGFQVEQAKKEDYGQATANEAAQISDAARVISGVNQISILNAAGKTVTVTNVLGQTVAKTVATSDNATITLPKGIVVVSVDGKSTKAVVK